MPKRTSAQNRRIHQLLGKLGLDEEARVNLAQQYSGGRAQSTAELTISEARELIDHLIIEVGEEVEQVPDRLLDGKKTWRRGEQPPRRAPGRDQAASLKAMRSKILAIATRLGWLPEQVPGLADRWAVLNTWMVERSYLSKPLFKYTYSELPKLVSQMEAVEEWYEGKDHLDALTDICNKLNIEMS